MKEFVYSQKPITIERGSGTTLYDDGGTAYLDAGASYACTPVGHCHPTVVDAITEQASELLFVQSSYPTDVRTELIDRLDAVSPPAFSHIWLCNSGTEANEAALKFARSATDGTDIVAAKRSFHGRTMGTLSATWRRAYRAPYEPLVPGVEFVGYNDVDELTETVDSETAAIILEPIQGEGGIHPADPEFLQAARELATDAGAALIFDEIQTGLGRTGTFWGFEQADVEPDVITVAKGLASGLPMGATLCREWIAEGAGPHGSTFSGNPLMAAAANATLEAIVDEDLVSQAERIGNRIVDGLTAADLPVRDIRGQGLMIGIEVKRGSNSLLKQLALDRQILALPAGRSVLRLLPPLILTEEEADELVDALVAEIGEADE